jgi:hypothetical protein
MTDELEEIRAKKMAALGQKITDAEKQFEEIDAMKNEFTWEDFGFEEPEWGFRVSQDVPDAVEVCQKRQTVALTQSPEWAMLVCDLLNRAKLEELIVAQGEKKDE